MLVILPIRWILHPWYIAGINGEDEDKSIALDLSFLSKREELKMIAGGSDQHSFVQKSISLQDDGAVTIDMDGNDGFVIVAE